MILGGHWRDKCNSGLPVELLATAYLGCIGWMVEEKDSATYTGLR